MDAFSKFYPFGTVEIRLFFHNADEGGAVKCAATIGVNADASPGDHASDKALGMRVGEALRGTLARVKGEHDAGDLEPALYDAARAALVELAAAIGLKKDTKKREEAT